MMADFARNDYIAPNPRFAGDFERERSCCAPAHTKPRWSRSPGRPDPYRAVRIGLYRQSPGEEAQCDYLGKATDATLADGPIGNAFERIDVKGRFFIGMVLTEGGHVTAAESQSGNDYFKSHLVHSFESSFWPTCRLWPMPYRKCVPVPRDR